MSTAASRASRWTLRATIVTAAVVIGVGGLGVGAAVALGPVLFAPAGLSAGDGIDTQQMPAPDYPRHADGLTYGSAGDAISPDTEPDLILVVASNGREGYVSKADLDDANGSTAAESFRTPEDAVCDQLFVSRLSRVFRPS